MALKTKLFDIKSITETGEVTGYFSTYDVVADAYGDIIAPHAFDASIKAREEIGKPFPLVWNHNMEDPELIIGQVDKIEDDEHGPLMTAHFYDTPKAQAVRNLVKEGSVYQFSFAYEVDAARKPNDDEKAADPNIINVLEAVNLLEVTITPTPANPRAEVISAKADSKESEVKNSEETEIKSGRRNRKSDEDIIKQIISLANSLLDSGDDDTPEETESAKEESKANEGAPSKELEALNARRDAVLEFAANNNIYGGKEK